MISGARLRVAVCGLGSAAIRAHFPALLHPAIRRHVMLVAVCDRNAQRLTETRRTVAPHAQIYSDIDSLLSREAVDLLVIATPPSSHLAALLPAAEQGVQIVCEKPLGLSDTDLVQMRSVADQRPRQMLATVLQYRHAPAWTRVAEIARASLKEGDRCQIEIDVERPGTDPFSAGGWRANPLQEGGIIGDHAVHHLSLLNELADDLRIDSCRREGEGGRETAIVELSATGLFARIRVTYAGANRRNRTHLTTQSGRSVIWSDDRLAIDGSIEVVGSLSDRDFVNTLYVPWYENILISLRDPLQRAVRTRETLEVASLLNDAIHRCAVPAASGERLVLNSFARAVLLAFADLGIYLPSQRERLVAKINSLNPLDPGHLENYISLCVEARLLTHEEAGKLRLSPSEAARLAQSLEGATPVPDVQADAWVRVLHGANAS